MTFYVLGLTVTSPQGQTWAVAPHTSGLTAAEGGFETSLGWYGVKWTLSDSAFTISLDVPSETSGTIRLPYEGQTTVNGRSLVISAGAVQLAGGHHDISVQF